jgi:ABC-type dipeptide/oligopeptide/nickel transport system permease subunit
VIAVMPRLGLQNPVVRRVIASKAAVVALAVIGVFLVIALFAPWIAPRDPLLMNIGNRLEGPTAAHVLGTDGFGRDILTRLMYGTRLSFFVAFVSVALAAIGALAVGTIAGYYGGAWDFLSGRIIDVLLSFPPILLALVLIAGLGPNVFNLIAVIIVLRLPGEARLVRSMVLSLKQRTYVEAARCIGANDRRIMLRHIIPHTLGTLSVLLMLGMASAIYLEAAFGFLGLGAQPPEPSWGTMMREGLDVLRRAPHLSLVTGGAIFIASLCFNALGDVLRDAFDPTTIRR